MTPTCDRETFVITLEALPDKPGVSSAPAPIRLRQLLKIALRGLRFKCVDITGGGQAVNSLKQPEVSSEFSGNSE